MFENNGRNEPIVREGFRFIIPLGIITAVLVVVGLNLTAVLFLLLTVFSTWFFRNPERTIPAEENVVVSPADGKILRIEEVEANSIIRGKFIKISIFMNIFDVHVNRIPFTGIIEEIAYSKGRFISANLDKASDDNERNSILLRTPEGEQIFFIQIAGFIARRIVCWVNKGNRVTRGARFGLICFGSRLELFLPTGAKITVKAGERVKAGTTKMGYLS